MNEQIEHEDGSNPRWYVATVIMRCLVNGHEGNPYNGTESEKQRPAVQREVMLVRAQNAEEAYERALALGRTKEWCLQNSESLKQVWEFAGLEDLTELGGQQLKDGLVIWSRCTKGLCAAEFVSPKEELSLFSDVRGWCICPPDQYWARPPEQS